jgi:hypothetical protein
MLARLAAFVGILAIGVSSASAQSNVRPIPGVARVPGVGAAYLGASTPEPRPEPSPWVRPVIGRPADPFASDYATLRVLPPVVERTAFTRLELSGAAHPAASFEGGAGELAIVRGGWEATLGQRIDDQAVFALNLEAEASFYDFSNAGKLMAGAADPFNDVYDSRLGLSLMEDPAGRTSWFSGIQLRLSGEDDARLGDALSVGLVGGLRHEVDDDLSLSLGVAALSRLEDDPWIFPYVGFDWRVADRLRLVSQGSEVGARFEVSDSVELLLGAEYAIRQFRLNDDSPLASGVVQDEEILAGLTLDWSPSERCTLTVGGGVTLWRELQSYDSFGTKLGELETDTSEFVSVSLSVTL